MPSLLRLMLNFKYMKNSVLLKYFIALFLPMFASGQSTSSASVTIRLGDFHQLGVPKLDEQMVFLDFNPLKNFIESEEEGTPVLLSSTGNFNLFARAASQSFSTLNYATGSSRALLALQLEGNDVIGGGLAKLGDHLNVGFDKVAEGKVSVDYAEAMKSNRLIVASQSLIGFGNPMMGKPLKLKYVVASQKAVDFFKDTAPESANKAVIYTITSN